jgi:hypothetical protein
VIVQPVTHGAALFVAMNMRAADAAEIFATWPDDDRAALADRVAVRGPFAWCVGAGEPIACIGAHEGWPGVFSAWMFATDRFPEIGFPLTRWVRRCMMPAIAAAGAHRAHAYSMEGHDDAHRWLEGLGAVREATHPDFGKRGETFHVYAWGRP